MSEAPETKERMLRVPAALFFQLIDACRSTDRDSRRNDRVLHDATREMIADACDAVNRWQDKRLRQGGRA